MPRLYRLPQYAALSSMRPFMTMNCPALLLCACDAPPAPCNPPPYADLSRFAPATSQIETDCGVAIGALVRAEAGSARVLATPFYDEPGAGIYVVGRIVMLGVTGR